jgi:hypothetical protein
VVTGVNERVDGGVDGRVAHLEAHTGILEARVLGLKGTMRELGVTVRVLEERSRELEGNLWSLEAGEVEVLRNMVRVLEESVRS